MSTAILRKNTQTGQNTLQILWKKIKFFRSHIDIHDPCLIPEHKICVGKLKQKVRGTCSVTVTPTSTAGRSWSRNVQEAGSILQKIGIRITIM
jgi:hypothetical protein